MNNESIDASDILAPSELEDSDLLKNEDFSFDLASKSLLFMASAAMNDDDRLNITLPSLKNAPKASHTQADGNLLVTSCFVSLC